MNDGHQSSTAPAPPETLPGAADLGVATNAQPNAPTASLNELRDLLFGQEQRRLAELEAQVEVRPEAVGAVLSDAVRHGYNNDPRFKHAIRPVMEQSLGEIVKRNPEILIEVIFPLLGPIIRRAVASGIASMNDNLNRALEYSLSPKGLSWRLEAWRTGKPFAEIVFLKTLRYRVDHVFLIHKETGLLIEKASNPAAEAADPDLISAMLTAVRDFARDSFALGDNSLERINLGDFTLLIEEGPRAMLSVAVRGTPDAALGRNISELTELLHARFQKPLAAFNGDPSAFAEATELLENLLSSAYLEQEPKPAPQKRRPWWHTALAVAALVGLGVVVLSNWREGQRWQHALAALSQQPGVVVLRDWQRNGKRVVQLLHDPLAANKNDLYSTTGYTPKNLELQMTPYQSLEPSFILARFKRVFDPPASLRLFIQDGRLVVQGQATHEWLSRATNLVGVLEGVRLDVSQVTTP